MYLLHLDPPYKHARHYTGFTTNLERRLEEHRSGLGARLMQVVKEAGGSFRVARTWPGTRGLERAIKDMRAAPRLCPECSDHPLPLKTGHAADTGSHKQAAAEADSVPEPEAETVAEHLEQIRPHTPVVPWTELEPVLDRLEAGWLAERDAQACTTGPEPELELLPPSLTSLPSCEPKERQWASGTTALTPPVPPRRAAGTTTDQSTSS